MAAAATLAEEITCQTIEIIATLRLVETCGIMDMRLQLIELKLHVVLTWLRVLVVREKSASGARKRAVDDFVDGVLGFISSVCRAIDLIKIHHWRFDEVMGAVKRRTLTGQERWFDEVMGEMKSMMKTLTEQERWLTYSSFPLSEQSQPHRETTTLLIPDINMKEKQGLAVGIEEDVQIIIARLIGGKVSRGVISIVGNEGIGKTTLAQKVYMNSMISRHFPCCAWVTVTQQFDKSSVILQIAKQAMMGVGIAEREWHPLELMWRIPRLLRLKRYLIVLDDIPTPKAWNTLQALLPQTSNGSRIIVTTRNRDLLRDSGPDCYIHEMRVLSDEEGWTLFNTTLGFSVPLELEQLGREIVKKYLGLPRAISAAGNFLSRKPTTWDQWSMMLNLINDDRLAVYHTLNTTAEALSPKAKDCLFYFGYFHQDYDIPARRLFVLWVAEGLFHQESGHNKEPPESVAEKILMELIQQNMIQVAKWKPNRKVKSCRINYLLRDTWLAKAEEASFLQSSRIASSSGSGLGSGKIMRLVDHFDREELCFSHIHGRDTLKKSSFQECYGDLRSFLSFDAREGPDPGEDVGNFLRRGIARGCFKRLKVIDLEGVFQPRLPESLGKIVELRYLGLRRTYLGMLPSSIGNLLNLLTLDLKQTKISTLPPSLWKIQKLRHIYLSEGYRCRFVPPPSTSSPIDIQTLWGAFVDEKSEVEYGLDKLINLRKLGLMCQLTSSQQKPLAEWIAKLNHLESLRLKSIDEMVRPSNLYLKPLSSLKNLSIIYLFGRLVNPIVVDNLPESLTEITLSVSGLTEDPMPKLGKLPNLRILNLFAMSYTGKIMVCSSDSFPLLRVLNIWKLEEVEEWIVEEGALTILKELEIRSCNKLEMIPDGLQNLVHCSKLKLTKMPNEFNERVTENQGQDWSKVAHVPSIIIKD
ncbi:Disease resistance RPP8-like protein [Actinidia chinensis var. chinensis]|uniref:Disease resistance RPP8-like protein n=1 Tax=Actinidia chinensis var. chinensis TaxID=1590841 RepID=A0A2R6PEJ6_ACTCC|nr:Disease resistance RPP8-like protein [Actinidia chinensis var. chinensis]